VTQHHSEVPARQTRPAPSVPPAAASDDAGGGSNKGLVVALVGMLGLLLLVAAGAGVYFFASQEDTGDPVVQKDAGVKANTDKKDAGVPEVAPDTGAEVARQDAGARPDAAQEPVGETGKVVVISTPPVHVFHGPRDLGATPLKAVLPLGEQKLTLRDPRRGIFKEVTVKVSDQSMGEVVQTFEFGSVLARVPSRPGVALWVDGAPYPGDTKEPIVLSAGPHLLELRDAKGEATASRPVTVEPDKESQIKF
jgi:hypothetical protein